jgi:hypothetical protein
VAAADDWEEPVQIKEVRPSHAQSYERLFHDSGLASCVLDFDLDSVRAVREKLLERRIERFIGVIYRPGTELRSHYAQASLPRQFNAFVWFDQTHAVTPLPGAEKGGVPDTFPSGSEAPGPRPLSLSAGTWLPDPLRCRGRRAIGNETGPPANMPSASSHGDLHLDSPLRTLALRNPELADLIAGATRQRCRRWSILCLRESVDALLISGDLYDASRPP